MFRFLIRVIGFALLAGAFVTFVIDGTRSVASSHMQWVRIGEALDKMMPNASVITQVKLRSLHPLLWDPIGEAVLAAPLLFVLLLIGVLLIHFTEDRAPQVGTVARR